jgi:hypothetical protein
MEIASPKNRARKDEGHCSKIKGCYHSKIRIFALLKACLHGITLLFFELFAYALFLQV